MTERIHDRYVGNCGHIFDDFEVCDECKIDDLCSGCSFNDDEDFEENEEEI